MLTRRRQRDLRVLAYFRHKARATFDMRSGQTLGREGMGLVSWLAIIVAALVVLSAVGLAIYGGRAEPPTHQIEQVVPDDSLPH
jgi:hypothetical protein